MRQARKKKGFTLVELLVTLACAAIFLACLSTSMVLLSRLGGRVLDQSADQYKLGVLADYVRSLHLRDTADAPSLSSTTTAAFPRGNGFCFPPAIFPAFPFFRRAGLSAAASNTMRASMSLSAG